jgi:hypothetical protein
VHGAQETTSMIEQDAFVDDIEAMRHYQVIVANEA